MAGSGQRSKSGDRSLLLAVCRECGVVGSVRKAEEGGGGDGGPLLVVRETSTLGSWGVWTTSTDTLLGLSVSGM